jgi:hypothetical protein
MKRNQMIAILAIILMLSSFLTMLVYSLVVVKEVKIIRTDLEISEVVGIVVDSDNLRFGKIPPRGVGRRKFNLTNEYKYPLKVQVKIAGEIEPFVKISDNLFWLQPGETREVTVKAYVPDDAILGEKYYGKFYVYLRKY